MVNALARRLRQAEVKVKADTRGVSAFLYAENSPERWQTGDTIHLIGVPVVGYNMERSSSIS